MNKALFGAVLSAFLFPMTVNAETISEALLDCSKESNSLKRLVCYDRLVKDIKQYEDGERPSFSLPGFSLESDQNAQAPSAQTPVTPAAPVRPAAPARDEDADFGLSDRQKEDKKEEKNKEKKKIYLTIAKIEQSGRINVKLTFENGQVWRQTDNSRGPKLRVGDVVYIERAALGSFVLSKDDVKKRIRVKRER